MSHEQQNSRRETHVLALSAPELARLLGVSTRHLRRLDRDGLIPRPVRFGRSVRWAAEEIRDWLSSGAPSRRKWAFMKKRRAKSNH